MMALRAHQRGGPETLVYESAPKPVPAPGHVLIAVDAASITFTELNWDETWTRDGQSRLPIIPSHEVAGIVSEVDPLLPDVDLLAALGGVGKRVAFALRQRGDLGGNPAF